MSLIGTFQIGLNALQGHSRAIGTISDNIANIATDGYKRFETHFEALYTANQQIGTSTAAGSRVAGHGITSHARQILTAQGAIRQTGQPLDLAIAGRGYFMVAPTTGEEGPLFTRDGSFQKQVVSASANDPTSTLYLANRTGSRLMGWDLRQGGAGGAPTPIRFDLDNAAPELPARPTSRITYNANLPAGATGADDMDRTTADAIDLPPGRVHFRDDLGNLREFNVVWRKVVDPVGTPPRPRENTWDATFYGGNTPEETIAGLPEIAVGAGALTRRFVFSSGEAPDLGINAGTVLSISDPADPNPAPGAVGEAATLDLPLSFTGGSQPAPGAQTVTLDFGRFGKAGGLTQVNSPFIEATMEHDGYPAGEFVDMRFDDAGNILVKYSNGLEIPTFRVAFATFANDNGLSPVKGNEFRQTPDAGGLDIHGMNVTSIGRGSPVGTLVPGAIEGSNAQIESEFTTMIQTQKAYSAASKIIQVVDQMTTTVRDLK